MGVFNKMMEVLTGSNKQRLDMLPVGDFMLDGITIPLASEQVYLEYAISMCINKIANALSQCTIETYEKGKIKKGEVWYQFNVEPNINQNITDFWNKLVLEMVVNPNGALIVQSYEGYWLMADSYTIMERAVKDNVYKDVRIGDFIFNREFKESDVLHLKLSNKNVKQLVASVYTMFGKVLTSAVKNYNRKNSRKVLVKIDTMFETFKNTVDPETGQTEYDLRLDDLFKNRLVGYFSESDSATPIEKGLEIEDKTSEFNGSGSKYRETDDIRGAFDDIVNMVADIFNIPRGLLKGDTADVEAMTDNFISFCINPIAGQLEDEINRKLYGKKSYLDGTKMIIKTSSIKSYDLTKIAASVEALYRIRTLNTNEVRRLLKYEEIGEDWANEYMETKNYQPVNQKGGEIDGE